MLTVSFGLPVSQRIKADPYFFLSNLKRHIYFYIIFSSMAEKRKENLSLGDTSKARPKSLLASSPPNSGGGGASVIIGVDTVDPSPVIEEFQYLLEKSQQLFSGLR
jgi:hypothetical protein